MKRTTSLFPILSVAFLAPTVVTSFTNPTPSLMAKPTRQQHQPQRTISTVCSATPDATASSSTDEDGDLHPSDDAKTTPEFLAGLWQLIAKGNHMVRGVSINSKGSSFCLARKKNVVWLIDSTFFLCLLCHSFLAFQRINTKRQPNNKRKHILFFFQIWKINLHQSF